MEKFTRKLLDEVAFFKKLNKGTQIKWHTKILIQKNTFFFRDIHRKETRCTP